MSRKIAVQNKLIKHVRSRYSLIKPVSTQGMFNYRCHENSVQYAINHATDLPGLEIWECIYIDDIAQPTLHYLNFDPVAGKYLETTLGWQAEHYEFYVIRRIHPSDWPRILREFENSLESWCKQFTTWFDRSVLGIRRIL